MTKADAVYINDDELEMLIVGLVAARDKYQGYTDEQRSEHGIDSLCMASLLQKLTEIRAQRTTDMINKAQKLNCWTGQPR